ncbi:MAG: RND family efflux transporter MFP subunit [Gammaproteobacteria bacterium]|nr:MAG: RND family efflux transporter MFP subunit [Gammaproteobacteria bacterium]TND03995.1 MAG: RND family efflux transporter MFP subunit [Gammaproteobacteria bacterium]
MRASDRQQEFSGSTRNPDQHSPGRLAIAGLAAVIVVTLLTGGCGTGTDNESKPVAITVTADVINVIAQAIPETYTTAGTLVANGRVDIASRLLGEIRNLAVREGQAVTTGQRLLTIDATEITNRLNEVQARLSEARAQSEEARADLERHQKLLAQKAISERAVEQARLRYDVTRESVHAADAATSQIRAQLEYTDIRSPVTGVVVTKHKQNGDMATPGAPILTIEDPSNIEVETFIKESYVNQINPGDKVQVSIDALRKQGSGTVTRVVRSGETGTYRYLVKVVLSDVSDLRAGMFARVEFPVGEKTGIAIPNSAIIERSDIPGVYLVDENAIAHFRMVRTGRHWQDQTEIVAGLSANDRIAITNTATLRTGDRIEAAIPAPLPQSATPVPGQDSNE